MTCEDYQFDDCSKRLLLAIRQSGIIAVAFQRVVQNEGKAVEGFSSDSERLQKKRAAKTLVDLVIQDVILLAVLESNIGNFILDAEESTPLSTEHKGAVEFGSVVIVDPIDGTLEYVEGRDNYSVCLAINRQGKLPFAGVYFPRRDTLYLSANGRNIITQNYSSHGLEASDPLELIAPTGNIVYINRRVPQAMSDELRQAGFDVRDDEEWDIGVPDVLLGCINGSFVCYISHSRQIRDVLLGGIIGNAPNGYAIDWAGRALAWPNTPRVSRAIFGVGSCPKEILEISSRFI